MFGRIPQMDESEAADYEAFLIGNDPVVGGLESHAVKQGNVAIVATSCFRALQMACQLSNKSDRSQIPKVVIIDHSRQVHAVWKLVQVYFADCDSREQFSKEFIELLKLHAHLFRVLRTNVSSKFQYPSQNINKFFQGLFDNHGFDYVRAIVMNVSVILQKWECSEAFKALKAELDKEKYSRVVVYPSNIVAMNSPVKRGDIVDLLLRNIALLKPALVIHTDYCHRHYKSEQAYLFTSESMGEIKRQLFNDSSMPSCHSRVFKLKTDAVTDGDELAKTPVLERIGY